MMEPLSKKIEKFGSVELIPYGELLDTTEWDAMRWRILSRDKKKCIKCGMRPHRDVAEEYLKKGFAIDIKNPPKFEGHGWTSVVHHKYYIMNKLPWEYEEALVTLCLKCHQELHQTETIPVYYENDGKLIRRLYRPCIRCDGAGWFPEYSHVQHGVCFRCGGWGWEELMDIKHRNIQ